MRHSVTGATGEVEIQNQERDYKILEIDYIIMDIDYQILRVSSGWFMIDFREYMRLRECKLRYRCKRKGER